MIAPDGSQLGILPTEQALQQAYSQNLDLVEEKSGEGSFELSSPLAPDAVELIVLQRR